MPTYSYRCTECDNAFDIHQSFTDKTLTECPVCGGKLRKVFSPVGVTFKGSGFYRTDSRKTDGHGGKRKHTKSDSATTSESTSDSKSESKSDSKSESASGSKSDSTGGGSTSGSTSTSTSASTATATATK